METFCEDEWFPHAMEATLAADGNGVPAASGIPIVAGNVGEGRELLAHAPGIMLQKRFEEEELVLRREVSVHEQGGERCPSLTGCQSTVIMYQKQQ